MKLLKPRSVSTRLIFYCPAKLAEGLESIAEKAKALTIDFLLFRHKTVLYRILICSE